MTASTGKAFLGHGWAFPVQPAPTGDVELAAYDEDVRQAVLLILQCNHGERVMRPDFGADLQRFVFEPVATTTFALLQHAVQQALVLWEPRIDVMDVTVRSGAPAQLLVEIAYRVRATNTFYNLVYPFYLLEGEQP